MGHRTGLDLSSLDLLLWPQPNAYTAADLLHALADIKTIAPRGSFAYSNAAYALAGEVVARTSGQPYAEFVRQRIFEPLGMQACRFGGNHASAEANLAVPHARLHGQVRAVRPDEGEVPVALDAEAGGARCDAISMGRWLQFLADPVASGVPLLAQAAALAAEPAEEGAGNYGLGLELDRPGGEPRLSHFGGVAGMLSFMALYPQRRAGFAVMLNLSSGPARQALIAQVETSLMNRPRLPIAAPVAIAVDTGAEPASSALAAPEWSSLQGIYESHWMGRVVLCEPKTLQVSASPRLQADLRHSPVSGETLVIWRDPVLDSDARLLPTTDRQGRVSSFHLLPIGRSDFDFGYLRFLRRADCP